MIPRTWGRDLTARERLDLVDLLQRSPGLWPFGIVAGTAGLDQAVDACDDHTLITMDAADKLRAASYLVEACLPAQADVLAILMGIRLCARMHPEVRRGPRPTLAHLARGLGLNLTTAQAALRTLHDHSTTPAYERFDK